MTSILNITYTILDGNLGALGSDRVAVERYADQLRQKIADRYPDAEINVDIQWNTGGVGGGASVKEIDSRGFEIAPDDQEWDTEAVETTVGDIAERVFETAE